MKRSYQVIFLENQKQGYAPGDQAAHFGANALAEKTDYPTIEAVTDMVTMLERIGGQMYVTALRIKNVETGEYDTHGLAFNYETRDVRLVEAGPPEEAFGFPVTDSQAPPEVVTVEAGPTPELEGDDFEPGEAADLRDEIEAEVAAALDEE